MFTSKLTTNYEPQAALVVYKRSTNDQIETYLSTTEYHIEHADIVKREEEFILGATTPYNSKQLDDLAKFLNKRETKRLQPYVFEGFISKHIHFTAQEQDKTRIICSLIAPKRHLYFSENLNIPSGEVLLPNLLFIKSTNSLRVLAFKGDELNDQTIFYKAPFHNTSATGVCMGSAKIKPKKKTWEALAQAVDNAFFNSMFTHLNGGSPLKEGFNLNTILSKCIKQNKPFPLEALDPLNIKLSELIK